MEKGSHASQQAVKALDPGKINVDVGVGRPDIGRLINKGEKQQPTSSSQGASQAPYSQQAVQQPSASAPAYDAAAAQAAAVEAARAAKEAADVAKRKAKDEKVAKEEQVRQAKARKPSNRSPKSTDIGETSAWQRMRGAIDQSLSNLAATMQPEEAVSELTQSAPLNPSFAEASVAANQGTSTPTAPAQVEAISDETILPAGSVAPGDTYSQGDFEYEPNTQRGETILSAGTVTPGEEEAQQSNPQEEKQASQDQPSQKATQQPVEDERPMREQVDEFIQDYAVSRQRKARKTNEVAYAQWRARNPKGTRTEYEMSDEFIDDAEAFDYALGSLVKEHYGALGELGVDEEGNPAPTPAMNVGTDVKDTLRQDRLIDNVVRAFKLGFFHVGTEHVEVDKDTGKKNLQWGLPVQNRIKHLCQYLGMDETNVDSQRTVFRLVTLYCSMGYDRNGKMFNQDKDQWTMTEQEFCDACDMIYRACVEKGNPLTPPWRTSYGEAKLRGTEIIPSGVLPKVVAQAITGPDSKLRVDGVKQDAAELIESCKTQWVTRTYPYIKENLVNTPSRGRKKKTKEKMTLEDGRVVTVEAEAEDKGKNLVAQRIAIEDMQQALARLDTMDANAFSTEYHINTQLHYTLEEYRNSSVNYISAMNDNYDARDVEEYQRRLLAEIESKMEEGHRKEIGAISIAANTVVSAIRTNALFWNVPIAMSAIVEKKVGNIQTDWTIGCLSRLTEAGYGVRRTNVSDSLKDAFKTEEAISAIDGALLIMDAGGPGAFASFSKTGQPLTRESAEKFTREKILPTVGSERAARAQDFQRKFSRLQQKALTGDVAFRKQDATNFLNALLTSNQVLIGTQRRMMRDGVIDQHAGPGFTGLEFDDIFLANNGDVSRFMTEVIGTPAGRDAMIAMRANNIGNFNFVGYYVDKVLRSAGVPNALITTFFDSFPKYGINFLYTLTPFSRSLSYLAMKRKEAGGDITAGTLVLGGGLADVSQTSSFRDAMSDPAFVAGLRMNLIFDAMTLGRWALTTVILGGVMAMLGFEPPDHDEDWDNISMWKIGGQEIQLAYWLNDLTQLGLPGAYGLAAVLSGYSPDVAMRCALSSLYDQVDGNVVMDFIKGVKTWGMELAILEKMGNDPQYTPEFDISLGVLEMILAASDKIVPGAPLYRYAARSSILNPLVGYEGKDANPYKVYDKSDDWAKSINKTDYIDDPFEIMLRRHSTSNWLLATYLDFVNGVAFNPDSDKTGYLWWEMPPKGMTDQMVLTLAHSQKMDYTNREGCTTDEAYEELKTDQLLAQIDQWSKEFGGINQAVFNGFFISNDIRRAAQRTISKRIAQYEDERNALHEGRENWEKDWDAINAYNDLIDEQWAWMNTLKNKNIPSWGDNYYQIIGDTEITFNHEDGSPALGWEWLFDLDGSVTAEYKHKGNHPLGIAPFTPVDYSSNELVQRGFSGETRNYWALEGENGGVNHDAIRAGIGQEVIPSGRDEGKILNDVLYGASSDGSFLHPEHSTVGRRGLIPNTEPVPKDITDFDVQAAIDEYRKAKAAEGDEGGDSEDDSSKGKPSDGNGARRSYSTAYPRRVYGYGSKAGSGNYNPKIYSTRASTTHVTGPSRPSSTRTNSDSRSVSNDRADTMNARQPQSTGNRVFLRPTFATKGSREAYKRQDI